MEPDVRMDQIPKWFKGIRLNFAENALFSTAGVKSSCSTRKKEDAKIAVTEVREGCSSVRHITWNELRQKVGRLASAMREHGVKKGDRAAVVASNSLDTLVVFYAITSLGGLFSSSSTDMGTRGVLDRLTQIRPKWLFMDDGALYNGKVIDLRQKMTEIMQGMNGIEEFDGIVSVPRWQEPLDVSAVPKSVTLERYLAKSKTSELQFERVEFSDPFFIAYSSGTTGQPKCIVHGTGGVILSANKEGILHRDLGSNTVMLQYTTVRRIRH